jgi:hypothetical protein
MLVLSASGFEVLCFLSPVGFRRTCVGILFPSQAPTQMPRDHGKVLASTVWLEAGATMIVLSTSGFEVLCFLSALRFRFSEFGAACLFPLRHRRRSHEITEWFWLRRGWRRYDDVCVECVRF